MSVYAIKVWLSKSEKDWFLYRDLEDQVVHTYDSKEKAEEVINLLECNKAEITEEIPPQALARSTEKKQRQKIQQ
jgi:ribosome biogenesis protein Nip4